MAETASLGLYLPSRYDTGIPIDESLANNFRIIDDIINGIRSRFYFVNVKEYGAKGDGSTDDTTAFANALKVAKSDGSLTLYVPDGVYIMDGYAEIFSNTHIILSKGAIIRKRSSSTTAYVFLIGKTATSKGYGAGGGNIIIEGGRFEGTDKWGTSITCHHVSGLTVRNSYFYKGVNTGHVLDLAGCEDVLVEDCVFQGMTVISGREFAEAIQIDASTADALSGNFNNYDGLPARNVIIQRNKFIPIRSGSTITHPAPNPMGSHNFVQNQYYSNIQFMDNYIEDCPKRHEGNTGSWVRLYAGDGVQVLRNKFVNTASIHNTAVAFHSKNTGTALSDVGTVGAADKTIAALPGKDILVADNTFVGFKNRGTSLPIIDMNGHKSTSVYMKNVRVLNNHFVDNLSGARGNVGNDLISCEYVDGLNVEGNYAETCRRLVYIGNCKHIRIRNNHIENAYYVPISTSDTEDMIIEGNVLVNSAGGIYTTVSTDTVIKNNDIYDIGDEAYSTYASVVAMKTVTNGICSQNIIRKTINNNVVRAVHVYTSCENVAVLDNIILGFTKDIEVTSTTNSTIRRLFE